MTDHAACGPSSASMWMQCAASITLADGRTRPPSQYAKEGTAAHSIAEMVLRGELFPPSKLKVDGTEFIIGIPMYKAIRVYIDFIHRIIQDADEWHCEKRVAVNEFVWGTTDFAARSDTTLDIVDLKYGQGVLVSPDSAQLKIYALACANTLWPRDHFETVNMTIVQPRVDAVPKTHSLSMEMLQAWEMEQLQPAIDRIQRGDTTEHAGPWCRWCIRKNECKAYGQHRSEIAADVFDDGVDLD